MSLSTYFEFDSSYPTSSPQYWWLSRWDGASQVPALDLPFTYPASIHALPYMTLRNTQHRILTCQSCPESTLVCTALTDIDPVLLADLVTIQSLFMGWFESNSFLLDSWVDSNPYFQKMLELSHELNGSDSLEKHLSCELICFISRGSHLSRKLNKTLF